MTILNEYAVHNVAPFHFELQYRELLLRCLHAFDIGMVYPSRPGMNCSFVHAYQIRCNLQDNHMPGLTTKFIPLKKCFAELQWYMLGLTNAKWLQERNVNVWDQWIDHPLNERYGRESGEMGPIYGHLWRNFGATHYHEAMNQGSFSDGSEAMKIRDAIERGETTYQYLQDGLDQLNYVVDALRNNPHSRRIILSAWDPQTQGGVVLPPCHTFVQFFACNGMLYTSLTCRSTDVLYGLPWNALAYGMLTHILAHSAGLEPSELVITMNNPHLYENQIEAAKEHAAREPTSELRMGIDQSHEQKDPWDYGWYNWSNIQYDHQGPLSSRPDIAVQRLPLSRTHTVKV